MKMQLLYVLEFRSLLFPSQVIVVRTKKFDLKINLTHTQQHRQHEENFSISVLNIVLCSGIKLRVGFSPDSYVK